MKTLVDNTQVPDRCWYYLLDFKDREEVSLLEFFTNGQSLRKMNKEEFWKLFEKATQSDLTNK